MQRHGFAQEKSPRYRDSLFLKYAVPYEHNSDKPYYIANLKNHVSSAFQIIRMLDEEFAIISLNEPGVFKVLKGKDQIAVANDKWKMSPPVEIWLRQYKKARNKFILTGINLDTLLAVLKDRIKEADILHIDQPSNSVIVRCSSDYLIDHLLKLKEVIFVDTVTEPHVEAAIIGYDRSFHGINAVDYLIPNANGKNIVAGVKEQKIDETDIDLWKRILPSSISAATPTYHATAIASIIGGAGNSFYYGRGIAWGCKFFSSSFSNLFADDASLLNASRVTVQNHSYGTVIQQFYGAEAASYDAITWNYKDFLPVISSGNQGDGFATEGKYANLPGYANLTGNFKMAKNIITVGAVDNNETIVPLSSAGPAYDGRLAPQLVAHGPSGTSDAAAMVSGTVAVMQQIYADSNASLIPPASLVKAVLYNTADDIYKPGIDFRTGYGLLNSYAAIRDIQQKNYDGGILSAGQEWTKNIPVPGNAAQLKITLAWTDTIAPVNNNKALINDLDLEVIEMNSGIIYRPWVLNLSPHVDSLSKPSIVKRDSLNTSEQVSIRLPAAGIYQLKVKAGSVLNSFLQFHVSYRIDTINTFLFTSPLHASDVNKSYRENLTIRWRTFVADTNQTGNLYISYDEGANWVLLTAGLKLITNKFQWLIKDTNTTAILKMETGFGNFLSSRFIISRVASPRLDFNCTDSFQLSWNKHIYAGGYRVYNLADSPYLKPILTVTDTFVVLKKSIYSASVYAVEPILINGLPAARSAAVNIETQGIKCFYKTLIYNLLDTNKLNLILELSTTEYPDSIFFDQVTSNGQLIKTYGSEMVSAGNMIYNHLVNEVLGGITYVRARVKLKNGSFVYTDILPILTSGQKNIWFYPTPAAKNGAIKYILKQGIPADSPLQLFDLNGRLLRNYPSLPGQIQTLGLPSGVIIYRLLDSVNKTLETGKLIIQ